MFSSTQIEDARGIVLAARSLARQDATDQFEFGPAATDAEFSECYDFMTRHEVLYTIALTALLMETPNRG